MISALTLLSLALVSFAAANPYSKYPKVPKSASINGFADPIYAQVPECAKECLKKDTGVTPCPYWDPGCLCVMPSFAGPVAECIAENCSGDLVQLATDLAVNLCNSVGANTWMIPASLVTALSEARKEVEATATSSENKSEEKTLVSPGAVTSASSTTEADSSTASSAVTSKGLSSTTSAPAATTETSSSRATSAVSASSFEGAAAVHAMPVVALAVALMI